METPLQPPDARHGWLDAIRDVLVSRWFPLVAVGIALLLTFCSVSNGLFADDYFHRAVLNGSKRYGELLPPPQGMFRFVTGDAAHTQAWMDIGWVPWWTDPLIKAEFFQFVPTQTHIFDYCLWPDRPELMHVHSLVWLGLLVFLAAKFYRQILGPCWMAGAAALLFAIEDAHALPAGWICNRNSMIAACFGISCLMAHDLWRREGKAWALWLALILWGTSLCSKEEGIATCAYLFAYAMWLDKTPLKHRILTLVPYGVVLIVWRVVRDAMGFGVAHIGYYADPFTDAGRFFTDFLIRYPILLFGQWAGLSELAVLFGSTFWWIAISYISFLGLVFWPVLKQDRLARFFATGMLLAVVPVCATFPMDRLLMFTGLGAFGLMVRFWNEVFVEERRQKFSRWHKVAVPVAVLFVAIHIIAAPILLMLRVAAPWGPRVMAEATFPRTHFDETIQQQDLIVINPPIAWLAGYCQLYFDHEEFPAPRAVRALSSGIDGVSLRRTSDRTIEVSPRKGYITFPDSILRNEQFPLKVGDQVRLARMTATVLSVEDNRPKTVEFRFQTPLEDESLRWIQFRNGHYVPWTPPPVGQDVTFPELLKR